MSGLALEIDQALQQLDTARATRLERLLREVLALVVPAPDTPPQDGTGIRFPLVVGGRPISSEDVARLEDA